LRGNYTFLACNLPKQVRDRGVFSVELKFKWVL